MSADTHPYFTVEIGNVVSPAHITDWAEFERYDYYSTALNRARVLLQDDATLEGRLRVTKCQPFKLVLSRELDFT
jgi:hypothetical protein